MKCYPYEKGGGGKGFSHAEGLTTRNSFGVVLAEKLEVLAMLKGGGAKHFTLS